MPISEDDDTVPQKIENGQGVVCDICGSPMRPVGGCWFCQNCGQKKCNTDLT
ncbi:MAG: hypothetical protein V1835_04065 [Candidatus Micrarchaeota archaeon]